MIHHFNLKVNQIAYFYPNYLIQLHYIHSINLNYYYKDYLYLKLKLHSPIHHSTHGQCTLGILDVNYCSLPWSHLFSTALLATAAGTVVVIICPWPTSFGIKIHWVCTFKGCFVQCNMGFVWVQQWRTFKSTAPING